MGHPESDEGDDTRLDVECATFQKLPEGGDIWFMSRSLEVKQKPETLCRSRGLLIKFFPVSNCRSENVGESI